MKHKYLAVLCAAVLSACMFTGCGNKDTDNKETAKTASEEQQGTERMQRRLVFLMVLIQKMYRRAARRKARADSL